MSVLQLSIVPPQDKAETPAIRARRLYDQSRGAAMDQVVAVETGLARVIELAAAIAEGGDVYPAGVRDLCRRMAGELASRGATLEGLAQRNLHPH